MNIYILTPNRMRIYATSKEEMAQLRYQKEMERIKSMQEQR